VSFCYCGSGAGAQAPDGCSVELYRKLPYYGELDDYRALIRGTAVLELGCGAGRLTAPMLEWGARVTAVDNCAEMLAVAPEGARRLCTDIESLNLDGRFDLVLLASCLVNHPVQDVRVAFVETARRHLRQHGCLLLERHDPAWLREVEPGLPSDWGSGIAMAVEAVHRKADVVEMTLRYEADGNVWRHSSAVTPLSEREIEALLVGFGSSAWSGMRKRWLSAVLQ